ncbi:SGNH/GDSL hydrolase family protein [Lichenicoccus roseus]|uniref:Hydrolase n=1 Tax=Lichenicoccus roseus TaxID=2683649 RepID=A0A5R9J970_9PROT|nr:SGNH/GDSL hydrolase family protein [Lichenicoccus roseus]TLU74125.1 hydrolase [Lichenicoccus roseus]
MQVRTILCYGDSNTNGTRPLRVPGALDRYAEDERWPGLLRASLGESWRVIEEGLPGRTTVHDDAVEGRHRNGLRTLRACLESHLPLDLVAIMLGTNDLKARFSVEPADIAASVGTLLAEARIATAAQDFAPRLLVIAPVPIDEAGFLGAMFRGGAEKSRHLAPLYEAIAERNGADFLDAGAVARVSAVDGVHFEADQHAALARAMAAKIAAMFPG